MCMIVFELRHILPCRNPNKKQLFIHFVFNKLLFFFVVMRLTKPSLYMSIPVATEKHNLPGKVNTKIFEVGSSFCWI